jgi:DNA invertase Pin-like site-specific DNA recombinase
VKKVLYGYARVSSRDQNIDRQIIALKEVGVEEENIFIDKQSGKDFNRPSYQELLKVIKTGDMVIIKSIDRLGRNYSEILEQWRMITKVLKVDVKVIDMPLLDTSYGDGTLNNFIADLVLQILSFQAEQERISIKQRQAEGIAAAKQKGVKFGRPRKQLPSNFENLYYRYLNNEPVDRLAKDCKELSKSTLRLRLQERQSKDKALGVIV